MTRAVNVTEDRVIREVDKLLAPLRRARAESLASPKPNRKPIKLPSIAAMKRVVKRRDLWKRAKTRAGHPPHGEAISRRRAAEEAFANLLRAERAAGLFPGKDKSA